MKTERYGIERRRFLIGSAVLGGAALAGRPARAQGVKVLRLAHLEASDSSFHKAIEMMSQSVKQKTGGQVDIRVFPSGQLGGYRDIVEGLRLGTIDLIGGGLDYPANVVPLLVTGCLYYNWRSFQHADRVLEGPVAERYSKAMVANVGARIVGMGYVGMRDVFTRNRPVTKPADMQGLKIRVPEAPQHVVPMKALGANPTPIPYGEVYTSLQTGVVDAAEGPPSVITQQKFYEVSKYVSLTDHQLLVMQVSLSERTAAKLSPAEIDAINASARDAFKWQRGAAKPENAEALKQIKAAGLQIIEPDVAAFRDIVRPTWKQFVDPLGAEGAEVMKLIEAGAS